MTTWSSVPTWLLYGASGYTGRLIAEEAVRRGHRPVLAGRAREKLEPLASALGVEVRVASLEDPGALAAALKDLPLVLHAAGPFIHTITTFMAFPTSQARSLRWGVPVLRQALKVRPVRDALLKAVESRVKGPDEEARRTGRSQVWAQARASDGRQAQAWLEVAESYHFTAKASVRAIESLLARPHPGAWAPAGAFGADFVLGIEGSRREDSLS